MRPNSKLFAAAIFGLLAGCNQPAVTLKAPASQSSENTVRDWNDVGDQIASSLMTSGLLAAPPEPGTITNLPIRPVFIHQQAPELGLCTADCRSTGIRPPGYRGGRREDSDRRDGGEPGCQFCSLGSARQTSWSSGHAGRGRGNSWDCHRRLATDVHLGRSRRRLIHRARNGSASRSGRCRHTHDERRSRVGSKRRDQ